MVPTASRLLYICILPFAALLTVSSALSEIPPGYYDTADTGSAAALRQTLHDIIDDHTRYPYTSTTTDTWDILEEADEDPADSNNILDLYRNASYVKQGGGNDYYEREHSWPKSYGFPHNESTNYPYTDCHALFLSDGRYNESRSNKPYRTCDEQCTRKPTEENSDQGGESGPHPSDSNWTSGRFTDGRWETWMGRRGDVARALFYMDVRYEGGTHITGAPEPNLILTDNEALIAICNTRDNEDEGYMGMLTVLLEWHREDPVDNLERNRNDVVARYQGNRNPFIDHPEWVACVFEDDCGLDRFWINEIHYDNAGADAGEFVEIAGPAGTDLSGWTLVGYNGANGTVYRALQLSGVIPDHQNGIGTMAFDFSGLQNGAPDGIALVDPEQTVIEYLSYEGSILAINGPAERQFSSDIGVSESNETAIGHSLQKSGSGTTSSDFTWLPAAPATRGQPNTGQSF